MLKPIKEARKVPKAMKALIQFKIHMKKACKAKINIKKMMKFKIYSKFLFKKLKKA
jgi:hypothetical protein